MSVIETKSLTKVFPGDVRAVDGIDFQVNAGEIFAFLGPNGAGKTTTIKMLNTLIPPTSGSATVAGFDVVKNPAEVRKRIGYAAQDVGVDEQATGRENLTLYGHFYRLDGKTIKQRVKEIFDLVGLTGYEDKMVSTYSGGMRKRLDLAMGLIHQPQVIFLDEPTTGLDPQTRAPHLGVHQQPGQDHGRDHIPDHPLHGGSRPPGRPHRHHRPGQDNDHGHVRRPEEVHRRATW